MGLKEPVQRTCPSKYSGYKEWLEYMESKINPSDSSSEEPSSSDSSSEEEEEEEEEDSDGDRNDKDKRKDRCKDCREKKVPCPACEKRFCNSCELLARSGLCDNCEEKRQDKKRKRKECGEILKSSGKECGKDIQSNGVCSICHHETPTLHVRCKRKIADGKQKYCKDHHN